MGAGLIVRYSSLLTYAVLTQMLYSRHAVVPKNLYATPLDGDTGQNLEDCVFGGIVSMNGTV